MPVSFGFVAEIDWNFIVADISVPILGIDFMQRNHIIIDIANKTMTDKSGCVVSCTGHSSVPVGIRVLDPPVLLADVVKQFEQLGSNSTLPNLRTTHQIETQGLPVFARPRRLNPEKTNEVKTQLTDLLAQGVIRPSSSSWSSPIHLVKKGDGSWRMCGDYRALNAITIPDRYNVPYLQDFSYILFNCVLFSKIDLLRAYHQVPMDEKDISKTAICTPFGLYEYLRMPFGLRNAAQTQQRLMDVVFRGLTFVFVYLDDILIASRNAEEHRRHLQLVFQRLKDHGLVVNLKKSEFCVKKVDFLGHTITKDGIQPLQAKVEAITDYPAPKTANDLRRYLGMLNFYHRFIPHSALHQRSLQALITTSKKNDKTPINWTQEARIAFQTTKDSITNAAMLAHPAVDAELALVTDASDFAMGAALHQTLPDGQVQPLGFFSRKFTPTQIKYSTFDRELEAITQAIKHFEYWLEGRQFTVYTDHQPIMKAMCKKTPRSCKRQSERFNYISQHTTDIKYLPGKNNPVADALSRIYSINLNPTIDLQWIAELQSTDVILQELISGSRRSNLQLSLVKDLDKNTELWCDTTNGLCRPFVPSAAQSVVISKLHNLSHPGARSTAHLVASKFVWLNMDKSCRIFARSCLSCQRNKVDRHNHTQLGTFDTPDARFQHVHMDIVGPLPTIDGQSYLLTLVDRYTRWMEAEPMPNITAETVVKHFQKTWVARFGVPTKITTDQGRQFTSDLFKAMNQRLGVQHLRTTPYHPQANGLVERFHRTLKAALRCKENDNWVEALPTILLALRVQLKEDLGASPAQLVYGTTLRIPGEFLQESPGTNPHQLLQRLTSTMGSLRPIVTSNHDTKRLVYRDKKMDAAEFVFVRVDAVKSPLQSPYTGPHRVNKRRTKTCEIDFNGTLKEISVDRLKAATLEEGSTAPQDATRTV